MIAPVGVLKKQRTECPHKAAVYRTWKRITGDFDLRYDDETLRYYIDQSPYLQNLDKMDLKKSYRNAYMKFRRETKPKKQRNQIINDMRMSGEIIAARRLQKAEKRLTSDELDKIV